MSRLVAVRPQSHPLAAPFRISRGVKTAAEVVVVEIAEDGCIGRGESVPYARYGETVEGVREQLAPAARLIAAGGDLVHALALLPAGAARNALDCAIWDLQAKTSGVSVAARTGLAVPPSLVTAVTVSLDAPKAMAEAARKVADAPLIKVKLSADDPAAGLAAVAAAAPDAALIVDPNEGWTFDILRGLEDQLASLNVALVEQPLPAGEDAALEGYDPPAPICADESVHVAADLATLRGRYQAVNLKLDKSGGLTEALAMLQAAKALDFTLMTGCMVASSLAIAPALHLAAQCDFADLDGPWWLKTDHPGGLRVEGGKITPPAAGFWGDAIEGEGLWL